MISELKLVPRIESMVTGMFRLAGLSRIAVFFVVSVYSVAASAYSEICIGGNFVLTNVTPTIQTIAHYSDRYGGKHRILRGRFEFLAVGDDFIAGYLSTRFFEEDELVGLSGSDDKEGFFIVNKMNGDVRSGLNGSSFFRLMEERFDRKFVDFFKPDEIVEFNGCELIR